jgi:hypothetical protein
MPGVRQCVYDAGVTIMRRKLFTLCSAVSLLLCAAVWEAVAMHWLPCGLLAIALASVAARRRAVAGEGGGRHAYAARPRPLERFGRPSSVTPAIRRSI